MTKPHSADQNDQDNSGAEDRRTSSVPWASPQGSEAADKGRESSDQDASRTPSQEFQVEQVGDDASEATRPESVASLGVVTVTEATDSEASEEEAAAEADHLEPSTSGTETTDGQPVEEESDGEDSPVGDPGTRDEHGHSGAKANPTPDASTDDASADRDELRLGRWLKQVDVYTGPDALLDFNPVDNVHIDLSNSNPSGYAQLLSGRRTRLSTILRDRAEFSNGIRSAHAIRGKVFELDADHGLDAGFLAAGTASWFATKNPSGTPDGARGERRHIAPILLAPVTINPHPDGDDFELRINGPARLNPAMARQLRREFGIDLFEQGVHRTATSGSRLTPDAVLEAMRSACMKVPGMHIESRTVISTFADLADTVGELPSTATSGLLRELSDLNRIRLDESYEKREFTSSPAPANQVDPAEETLVYDADDTVSELVQRARAGESMTVTSPAGTQHLRAALNVAAGLVSEGKSVLFLAERRETLQNVRRRLSELGLSDLTLDLGEDPEPEELHRKFVETIVSHERAVEPRLSGLHDEIRSTRRQLIEHIDSLHWRDERWGVTPLQAMQTLAELTSQDEAPSTRVRFKRGVMDATVDRAETVAQLERAAELRAFNPSTRKAPWFGATLVNTEETKQARALVRSLLETTRTLRKEITEGFESIGLRPERTLAGWKKQLDLLEGIRVSLSRFKGDIFDRPVTDLIAATGTSTWRRERGIDMSAIQRSRLRRAAKEYIVPQVHISDLHQALIEVQAQREQWQTWAVDERTVSLPGNLETIGRSYAQVADGLSDVSIVMEESPVRKDYFTLLLPDLVETLEAMANDRILLDTLPEREQLLHILRGKGLEELLSDLEERHVASDRVAAELDLAWWQSAFEIMLERPEVNLVRGKTLTEVESSFRRADVAHIASGPARVRYDAARGWNRRVSLKPLQAKEFRRMLKGAPCALGEYLDQAPDMVAGLLPVWLSSPFGVGRTLPQSAHVDAVIVLDAESTPLGACLAALSRTRQVIAFGDDHAGYPQPFIVSPTTGNEQPPSEEPVESAMQVLGEMLPGLTLDRVHECRDQSLVSYLNNHFYGGALSTMPYGEEAVSRIRSLDVDYLTRKKPDDRVGAPVIESPKAEVLAVAEMVFEHAAQNPRQSLAVLTAGTRHAARIAEAVRRGLESRPDLREFFEPGQEPFRVLDLARSQGLRRDRVIFSLGVAAEAGSRSSHFGQLADRHGRQRFVKAMTTARFHTRVVTSLSLEQLQAADLTTGVKDLARFLASFEASRDRENSGQAAILPPEHAGSEFLSVYDAAEDERKADWLLADLVRRLRGAGAEVSVTPGKEVDAVATAHAESMSAGAVISPRARTSGDPETRDSSAMRLPVALSSDGTEAYAALSVRERSRLKPERLERTGWNHVSLWAVDVFTDPQSVADRILGYLGLEPQDRG